MISDDQNYRRVVKVKPQRNGDSPEREKGRDRIYRNEGSSSPTDLQEKEHYDVFCKVQYFIFQFYEDKMSNVGELLLFL